MDNQALRQLAERIVKAPDNETRIQELISFAPEALLGSSHRSSIVASTFSFAGAMTLGMVVGASATLMLVPGARGELRERVRKMLDRREAKAEAEPEEIQLDMKDPSKSMTGREQTPMNQA